MISEICNVSGSEEAKGGLLTKLWVDAQVNLRFNLKVNSL